MGVSHSELTAVSTAAKRAQSSDPEVRSLNGGEASSDTLGHHTGTSSFQALSAPIRRWEEKNAENKGKWVTSGTPRVVAEGCVVASVVVSSSRGGWLGKVTLGGL